MAMFAPIAAEALEGGAIAAGGTGIEAAGAAGIEGAGGSRALSGSQFGDAAKGLLSGGGNSGGSQPAETSGAVLDSGSGWEKS